ncbi:MAG: hypothetical protein F9K22_15095 [Bacteroidetes bacterium]|nr:MAG: hypothetical protein F9K22_15095 [Bacteroidota bacterium]
MAFYFIFWDGVGYGRKDPAVNPFFAARLPVMRSLFGGKLPSLSFRRYDSGTVSLSPVNTTMRVPGLPQSGTGQASIMTGINAPAFVGKHFGPHPYSTLVPVIRERNLFVRLARTGRTHRFVNGYPKRYFDYLFGPKGRIPVIAMSHLAAGGRLNTHHEVIARTAVSADISGTRWRELGHPDVPPAEPHDAGRLFHELGRTTDLAFFEYFITDHAGHARQMASAVEVLERMDGFLGGLLERFDAAADTILLISDHGNIEDLSVKTHTMNPVPLIVAGRGARTIARSVRTLAHITPAVIAHITGE